MKATLTIEVHYDPRRTDSESLASAMDRLLETARSIPGVLDEYGEPRFGEFFVAPTTRQRSFVSAADPEEEAEEEETARQQGLLLVPMVIEGESPATRITRDSVEPIRIDLPLLVTQRQLVERIVGLAREGAPYVAVAGDADLLEGLMSLTDAIVGLPLDSSVRPSADEELADVCDCQLPGYFCSGVPGILARVVGGRLVPGAQVKRCDLCQRYPSDEAALAKLVELGIAPADSRPSSP
jgi:hypothetical protein